MSDVIPSTRMPYFTRCRNTHADWKIAADFVRELGFNPEDVQVPVEIDVAAVRLHEAVRDANGDIRVDAYTGDTVAVTEWTVLLERNDG